MDTCLSVHEPLHTQPEGGCGEKGSRENGIAFLMSSRLPHPPSGPELGSGLCRVHFLGQDLFARKWWW